MRMKTFISSLLLLLISSESTSSFQQTSATKITTPPEIHQMNSNVNNHDTSDGNEQETLLQLPSSNPDQDIPTLQFGDTMRFEELGPIIINTDGTTRRIDNWDTLTDREKEVSWRRIKKRNEERRKALMEQQQQQQQQDGGAASGAPKQN